MISMSLCSVKYSIETPPVNPHLHRTLVEILENLFYAQNTIPHHISHENCEYVENDAVRTQSLYGNTIDLMNNVPRNGPISRDRKLFRNHVQVDRNDYF